MTLTAPRRNVRTYTTDGRERYADTGRAVNKEFGTHVVLWIVEDPETWARHIEAEGDAQVSQWPKRNRHIGESRRAEAYESAAQIRARGARRDWHSVAWDLRRAEQHVASLYQGQPNPGVRYEAVEITDVATCPTCHIPILHADGVWRHDLGRWPTACAPREEPAPEHPERRDGDFVVDAGRGSATCGYCNTTEVWQNAVLGYARLTGFYLLGIHRDTNTLVVLFEAATLTDGITYVAHHCLNIPDDKHREYAPTAVLARDSVVV